MHTVILKVYLYHDQVESVYNALKYYNELFNEYKITIIYKNIKTNELITYTDEIINGLVIYNPKSTLLKFSLFAYERIIFLVKIPFESSRISIDEPFDIIYDINIVLKNGTKLLPTVQLSDWNNCKNIFTDVSGYYCRLAKNTILDCLYINKIDDADYIEYKGFNLDNKTRRVILYSTLSMFNNKVYRIKEANKTYFDEIKFNNICEKIYDKFKKIKKLEQIKVLYTETNDTTIPSKDDFDTDNSIWQINVPKIVTTIGKIKDNIISIPCNTNTKFMYNIYIVSTGGKKYVPTMIINKKYTIKSIDETSGFIYFPFRSQIWYSSSIVQFELINDYSHIEYTGVKLDEESLENIKNISKIEFISFLNDKLCGFDGDIINTNKRIWSLECYINLNVSYNCLTKQLCDDLVKYVYDFV